MYLKAVDSQKNKVFVKINWEKNRSSRLKVFLRKGALKIGSRFTGEHQCRSVIPVKLQSNFIKIALWHGYSPVNLGSAKWRVQSAHVPYVLYMPICPTCTRAQVYFTDRKIKKWKFCTHTFLRVLSLILDLNFAIS